MLIHLCVAVTPQGLGELFVQILLDLLNVDH